MSVIFKLVYLSPPMSVKFQLVYLSPPHEPLVRILYFEMLLMSEFQALSMKGVTHYPQARRRRNHSMVASKVFMKCT